MFEEADFERRLIAVDWSAYQRVGFGSIPNTVLGLLRAKPSERPSWRDRLELCLLPQATLVGGTSFAVPFLLELLRERVASGEIYSVLVLVVICTEDDRSGELGENCRERIRSGLDVYLRDLADVGLRIGVRSLALDLTCRLKEQRLTWEPVVRAVYKSEPSSAMRAEIREWLDDETAL